MKRIGALTVEWMNSTSRSAEWPSSAAFAEHILMNLVEDEDGHWQWTGRRNPDGYGRCSWLEREVQVHRLVYEAFCGPIPEGLVIDHLCRVTSCANPDHLEPVTIAENVYRGWTLVVAATTHCKNGHELTEENVYIMHRGGRQHRHCRSCHRANSREWARKSRERARGVGGPIVATGA